MESIMKRTFNRRSSGFSRSGNTRSNYSKFPNKNKRKNSYEWSEIDLIKSIEYTKKAVSFETEQEFVPVNTFDSFAIDFRLKQNIKNKNYKAPSPVQDQAIPHILEGRDLLGIANTGTGKTAAFLIPLINKAYNDRSQKVLIVAPTRELAEQIYNDFRSLANGMNLYAALIIGGTGMRKQMSDLSRTPNFVIGTPGRLKDMIGRNFLNLSGFNNVVLDETDRMVDIGFVNEIKLFISMLPKNRQSLFFSATISGKVQEILNAFVKDPVLVNVKKRETCSNIRQDVVRISQHQRKVDALHDLLIKDEFSKVIVFGNTKWGVQKLSDELVSRGLKANAIHGDKRQNQRQNILEKFKRNEIRVLLATDVAARGLDINNVSHVINYELPKTYDDYVHRIGRTGRADKRGTALTFVSL
jgi:ATP-dependent RNA helicase RhlE